MSICKYCNKDHSHIGMTIIPSCVDVKISELTKDRDQLRTQLEIEQSKVARCVEFIDNLEYGCDNYYLSPIPRVEFLASPPPTTPNLVARARELEADKEKCIRVLNQISKYDSDSKPVILAEKLLTELTNDNQKDGK